MSLRFNPFTGTLDFVGGSSGVVSDTVNIPAGATVDFDTQASSLVSGFDYQIILKGLGSRKKTFRLSTSLASSGIVDQVYAKIGDPINLEINAQDAVGSYFIRAVNNEAYNVELTYERLA